MDADYILVATIQDMAEIFGQLRQEILHQVFVIPHRQAFQFLQASALRTQATFRDRFDGPDQIFAMTTL